MPFVNDHNYLTVHGTLYGSESFVFGLRFSGGDLTPDATMVQACSVPIQTFWTQVNVGMSNFFTLDFVKLARVQQNGKYPPDFNPAVFDYSPNVAGGNGTGAAHPGQTALVITARTAANRGLASRGRFYLPGPRLDLTATGRLPSSYTTSVATAARTMVNSLNSVSGLGLYRIMSNVAVGGANRVVTRLEVGDILDVQRRRTKGMLPELRSGVAIP